MSPSATSTAGSFSGPAQIHTFHAVLSDFDGTILDSTPAVVKFWHKIASELGTNPETILESSHGRRTIDTLALFDTSKANWDYVSKMESRIPHEFSTGKDVTEVPGSRELLASLQRTKAPWGIVTSGTRALISGWIEKLDFARPSVFVAAEDVDIGKPDPQGYFLGWKRLVGKGTGKGGSNLDLKSVLVLEDAPAGIRAGKAAGFKVVAVTTSHSLEQLRGAEPDWIVEDLRSVRVLGVEGGLVKIEIQDAWE